MAPKDVELCIFFFFASGILSAKSYTIGIDLGTTHSSVALYRDGQVEFMLNDQGNRATPSWVSFTGREFLIGEEAKSRSDIRPENTIFNIRRLMGRKFADINVQRDMKMLPYKVIDKDGRPHVEVKTIDGEILVFSPEEISAVFLQKLKETAEAYWGQRINRAVITVPACFNDQQRQAIRDAGTIAGFYVEWILSEPTAAVLAYALDNAADTDMLVFDLGGGKFEASLLYIGDEEVVEVLAKSCNTGLGGTDFDNSIAIYFIELIKKKYKKDISQDKKALAELLKECERVKIVLSRQEEAVVEIKSLFGCVNFTEQLTREQFEEMNMGLFQKTILVMEMIFQKANLKKSDIHEILLVGSSTRIPKVQQILKDFFGGKDAVKGLNPDEAVAQGAAIQGDVFSPPYPFFPAGIYHLALFGLGIETVGGLMTVLIPRGTILPTKKAHVFTTYWDHQNTLSIKVYEGERILTRDCRELGRFDISGIMPAPRGVPQIEVTFFIDVDNSLYVTAKDWASKILKSMRIGLPKKISEEEIEVKVKEAEKYAVVDRKIMERIEAQYRLEKSSHMERSTNDKNNVTGLTGDNENVMECCSLMWNTSNDLFDGREVMKGFNLDEGVDVLRIGEVEPEPPVFLMGDSWTTFSFGIETVGGLMAVMYPRDRHFPAKVSKLFTTYQDLQTTVSIRVFRGERTFTKDCLELGRFELSGIGPAPRRVPQIEVAFLIDASMLIHVTAKDKANNITNSIHTREPSRLSYKELKRKTREAKRYAEEDKKKKERIEAQIRYETYFNMNTSCFGGDKFTGLIVAADEAEVMQQIFWSEKQCPLTMETCEIDEL